MERDTLNNVNFKMFEDEFGNLKKQYLIGKYIKNSDDQWYKDEEVASGRNYYVIDNKIYFRVENSLIEANMDINSKTCGACYKIENEITNYKKITGNKTYFTEPLIFNNEVINSLTLCEQTYSDGTSFYYLQDKYKQWNVNLADSNINEIIIELKRLIDLKIDNNKSFYQNIINKIESLNLAS